MKTITFTEFRKNASELFSEVEKGEKLIVLRHGRAIAKITSPDPDYLTVPSWKKPRLKLEMKGTRLSEAILEERETV